MLKYFNNNNIIKFIFTTLMLIFNQIKFFLISSNFIEVQL